VNDLFAKLSSYNLFNNLLPGALYCSACSYLALFTLDSTNLVAMLVTYYFVGLVISRIGSVAIEPLLRKLTWVRHSPYKTFVQASKTDSKIDVLVETDNTYRAMLSLGLCLLGTLVVVWVRGFFPANSTIDYALAFLGLVVLFLLAHKKQASYIRRRVEIAAQAAKEVARPQGEA
jgi:hypothetical protein